MGSHMGSIGTRSIMPKRFVKSLDFTFGKRFHSDGNSAKEKTPTPPSNVYGDSAGVSLGLGILSAFNAYRMPEHPAAPMSLGLASLQGALVTLLYGSHLWTKPKDLSEKVSMPETHDAQGEGTSEVIILETVQEMPNTSSPPAISKEQTKAPA
jgi:hypothetical protein